MKNLLLLILLTTYLHISAQQTYVPDDNFEQALIDLGYDDVLDDYVLTTSIDGVISLDVSERNISNLTGIEDFTLLTDLYCQYNDLITLDVSQNTALTYLYCIENQLTNLDVSQNTALTELYCNYNQLTNLDVSKNLALTYLICGGNDILTLDITNNTALTRLSCHSNELTSLDVSQNTALDSLWCGHNQLTSLDVSLNAALIYLVCPGNQLMSLDVSLNAALIYFNCAGNQLTSLDVRNRNNTNFLFFYSRFNTILTCIFVDDAVWSSENWSDIDPASTFVETQAECDALGVEDESLSQNIQLYPNPIIDQLFINGDHINILSIQLYSVLGKIVLQELNNFQQIDVSNLTQGVYVVKIETDKGVITKKVVKK